MPFNKLCLLFEIIINVNINLMFLIKRRMYMTNYPNTDETMNLIEELVTIPSPTGMTDTVIKFVENQLNELNITTKRNRKGGLIATIPGKNDDEHRMLTAHVDTLGAMVKEVKDNGRLRLDLIGGFTYHS